MVEQASSGLMTYPAGGWRRWAFRMPIPLWRLGLAPLLGQVLMLITTWGRKSGMPRRTMVEYHALRGTKYAPSAFGARSDWYQNIQADPHVTVQTSDGVEHMLARRVTDDDELRRVYELFMRRDPVILRWYLDTLAIEADPADLVAKKERIYWLRFDPTIEPTPPPLEADLAWVWLIAGAALVGLLRLRRAVGDSKPE
jgi:deazaflavin-dependent oxidoreductase (nitroreductase family)